MVIKLNDPLSKQHTLCLITSENKIHNKLRENNKLQYTKQTNGSSATEQTGIKFRNPTAIKKITNTIFFNPLNCCRV
jgi:hypothetical protein